MRWRKVCNWKLRECVSKPQRMLIVQTGAEEELFKIQKELDRLYLKRNQLAAKIDRIHEQEQKVHLNREFCD